jgi:hypothetical protein
MNMVRLRPLQLLNILKMVGPSTYPFCFPVRGVDGQRQALAEAPLWLRRVRAAGNLRWLLLPTVTGVIDG